MVWLKSTTTMMSINPTTSLPDMTIVTQGGVVSLHKLVLISFIPDFTNLLCKSCIDTHEHITIVVEDISKHVLEKAVVNAYQNGNGDSLAQILGFPNNKIGDENEIKNYQNIIKEEIKDEIDVGDTHIAHLDQDTLEMSTSIYSTESFSDDSFEEDDPEPFNFDRNSIEIKKENATRNSDSGIFDDVDDDRKNEVLDKDDISGCLDGKEKVTAVEVPQKRKRGRPRKSESKFVEKKKEENKRKKIKEEKKDGSFEVDNKVLGDEKLENVESKLGQDDKLFQLEQEPQKKKRGRPRTAQTLNRIRRIPTEFVDPFLDTSQEFMNADLLKCDTEKVKTYSKKGKLKSGDSHQPSIALNNIHLKNADQSDVPNPGFKIDCEIQKSPSTEDIFKNIPFENFEEIVENLVSSLNDDEEEPRKNHPTVSREPGNNMEVKPCKSNVDDRKLERPEIPHKVCSEMMDKNGGEILTKLPYGWTKSYFERKGDPDNQSRARIDVVFRSPARDIIKTKQELTEYISEHNINHIRLSSFDFCPYNAGSQCTEEL